MYEKFIEAGKELREIKEILGKKVKKGEKLLNLAETFDKELEKRKLGAAFPINLSMNDIAAHYTPGKKDDAEIPEGILKVDVGVHIDGYASDSAVSSPINYDNELIKATDEALEAAIKIINPSSTLSELGKTIEEVITSYDFKPIYNLTGHKIERWNLHSGLSIYNYECKDDREIGEGIFAIEPFATTGKGYVKHSGNSKIYRLISDKKPRLSSARKVISKIKEKFGEFPFSGRHIENDFALRYLVREGILHNYPVLREEEGGMVAQSEHTVLVTREKKEVTT